MATTFNFSGVPDNAYKQFFDALAEYDQDALESLLDLNGLTEGMFHTFPSLFDSREVFKSLYEPWFGDRYKHFYPKLNRDARFLPKLKHEASLRTIEELRFAEQEAHLFDFENFVNKLNFNAALFNSAESQFDLGPLAGNIKPLDISRFNAARQLGGWGVAKIEAAQAQAKIGFKYAMELLSYYGKESGWIFYLRHPIGFSDPSNKELHKHNMPISSLRFVMSQNKIETLSALNQLHPAFLDQENYRFMFNRWNMRHATATFESALLDEAVFALTPEGMPGGIVLNFNDPILPVTIESHCTPGINDIWQRIDPLHMQQVVAGEPAGPLGIGPSESILTLGWLAAAHASIISAGSNPGYGNKCIYWTHSSINAAFIDFTMHITPYILETARKELNQ